MYRDKPEALLLRRARQLYPSCRYRETIQWFSLLLEPLSFYLSPQRMMAPFEQNLRYAGQYFDNDKFVGNKFEQRLHWPD
ncbi:TPA: hypothetical protein ACG0QJ_002656 [Proteus mirabilis]